jgi:hypothetical protein
MLCYNLYKHKGDDPMALAIKTNLSGYLKRDIRSVVAFALDSAASQARQRFEHYSGLCGVFEQRYSLGSDEFLLKFEAGELGDESDYFDWYAAKHGLDIWQRRYEILSGISV